MNKYENLGRPQPSMAQRQMAAAVAMRTNMMHLQAADGQPKPHPPPHHQGGPPKPRPQHHKQQQHGQPNNGGSENKI